MMEGNSPIILVNISLFPAEMINADIHRGLPDKGGQAARFLQIPGAQFFQGDDECVLAKIVRKLSAAGAFQKNEFNASGVAFDKLRFSVFVTGFDAVNEITRLFS